jgi:succinate dehydrogenase / fumarate reductase membrane anchor subunit
MKSYRSPLGKARGLGSAKEGSHHFSVQRFLAVVLVPLTVWFIVCLCCVASEGEYDAAVEFLQSPINAVLLATFLIVSFYHAALGLQMVIEDYIHTEVKKNITLYFCKAFCFLGAAVGVLSILTVYFKG